MRLSRTLLALTAVSMLLFAVSNAAATRPNATASQTAACNLASPTPNMFPCTINGTTIANPQALGTYCQANPSACSSQQPGGGPPSGGPPSGGPPSGGPPSGGQPGGGQPGGEMKPCAPGVLPTYTTPCLIPDCEAGQKPSPTKPCRSNSGGGGGGGEGEGEGGGGDGGFDAPPTARIQKEMKSKYMVINIDVEGSGEKNGSFDVTFQKVVSGVSKTTIGFLNDQLEGDSFVIETSAKTVCFADTPDKDKVPDKVSCRLLDEAADDFPGSIKSQFRGKVKFDSATYEPVFTASKIIFLKGTFNVAKIR